MRVRAASPADGAAGLLYESAKPYYDVYVGGEARAGRLLDGVYPRPEHAASWDICPVAEELRGVLGR